MAGNARFLRLLLGTVLLGTPTLRAEEPASPSVDELRQASLQEAFRLLRENYIRSEELDFDAINRAALEGLLERLEIGAELVGEDSEDKSSGGFRTLVGQVAGEIGYLRLALDDRLPRAEELDSLLAESPRVILDLRSPDRSTDFVRAAEFLDLFFEPGELLFQIKKPDEDRGTVFQSKAAPSEFPPLVLLIDEETSPAAEIVAALLASREGTIVVGAPTPGRTVRYATVPIAEGVRLRYAEAEVVLRGGDRPYGVGVKPTISIPSDPEGKAQALRDAEKHGPAAVLIEVQRPRFSEAALVAGTNPELPELIERARLRRAEKEAKPKSDESELPAKVEPVPDLVLRQVVDFLIAADRLQIEPEPADE